MHSNCENILLPVEMERPYHEEARPLDVTVTQADFNCLRTDLVSLRRVHRQLATPIQGLSTAAMREDQKYQARAILTRMMEIHLEMARILEELQRSSLIIQALVAQYAELENDVWLLL
ncbi:hypothetical protein N7509_000164 [Penicillium cosmopolitanum]|uniref:Uncharacterized protein n=1 Tax=Penicillium cosmopolitanum TaxID=1131564 RepID=A0A9X0BF52_9EURO|nr:uncharacterized protein N7509_000164 [Penicillium cosmopolitanum]KAJ5414830.1 hypothetical protein N7509_000164 [Penicillium cosmopolitanum]